MITSSLKRLNLAKQLFPITLARVSYWPNALFSNDSLNMVSVSCVNLLRYLIVLL